MNQAGIFHSCGGTWCYPTSGTMLTIRLWTAANDIDRVELVAADPYELTGEGPGRVWDSKLIPMIKTGTDGVHDFWEADADAPYRRLKYWFLVHRGRETREYGEKGLVSPADRHNFWNAFIYPYIHDEAIFRAPDWVRDTVWYQIFPERFRNGDPSRSPSGARAWQTGAVTNEEFYGGDLAGIIEKLDHIADLGFNGIYLTPIFASPSAHKYDTTDYLAIDPAFGTEGDLEKLVRECHARGIRIILDAVFNHSGTGFAPWKDVLEKGEASRYRSWFAIDRFPLFPEGKDSGDSHGAGFHTFAFTTGMPKLNAANPEVAEYLISTAVHYVERFGIDGWRLDVANEIDHPFWREFRRRVKRAKGDAFIVGEIWHHAIDWLKGDEHDAVMNYHFGQAIANFLSSASEIPDGVALARRVSALEAAYPEPVIRAGFNLLDSHDTERLITRLGGSLPLAREAWLILSLLPGAPCFYYGSEFAVEGGRDPDCRRCMPWDDVAAKSGMVEANEGAERRAEQYAFIRETVRFRRRHAALINGGKRIWIADAREPDLFGVAVTDGKDAILLLVNRGKRAIGRKRLWKAVGRSLDARGYSDESRAWLGSACARKELPAEGYARMALSGD
ncbi:MAG TPA: glycoside hydrolase family 13 protein [Treponemataceae bacterium]|nr:glycoside hydrolase family 13 protein [Treponemataceae bacterium]